MIFQLHTGGKEDCDKETDTAGHGRQSSLPAFRDTLLQGLDVRTQKIGEVLTVALSM